MIFWMNAFAALASAQAGVDFSVVASTPSAQLGEPVEILVSASFPAQASLEFDLAASATDTLAVFGAQAEPAAADAAGRQSQRFTVRVLPLAVGRLPVVLSWALRGSSNASLRSPPAFISIAEPPLSPDGSPRDIKEPLKASAALWPWLLALAAAALAVTLLRRKKTMQPTAAAEPIIPDGRPPHVRALADLEALRDSGLWAGRRYKEFYAELTDVLRRYFDGRFGIPAPTLTTSELGRQLRQAEIDTAAGHAAREVFHRADMVKFAKITPEEEDGAEELESARMIVSQTAPVDLAAGSVPSQ